MYGRKLNNEEPHTLYASPNIVRIMKSRRMKWIGHVARMREMRNACKILVGKLERKKLVGRSRHRWKANITMIVMEIGSEGVEWMHPAGSLTGPCEHGNEPSGSMKGGTFLD
jgi:hypothetical protein